ncbi:MAG: hypothetical protein MJ183_04235 [Treponemataceae bacterium]|nr:hypothetical protein [Treponemataceae bacterium]
MTREEKLLLHRYGCFCTLLIMMFFILFFCDRCTQTSKTEGLKIQVEKMLSTSQKTASAGYQLGDEIFVESPLMSSCAVFALTDMENNKGYAAIIRISGVSGPNAAVFVSKPGVSNLPVFIGFVDSQTNAGSFSTSQIEYWAKKIQFLMREVAI